MSWGRAFRYARRYRNWRELRDLRDAGQKPRRVVTRSGEVFESPNNVNALRSVAAGFAKQAYTPRGFAIGADDLVVDVGANIGAFSVYAAKRTRNRVFAIEPFGENAAFVRKNVAANDCHVTVIEAALADHDGSTQLYVSPNGTMHQLFERTEDDQLTETMEIQSLSLGTLMEKYAIDSIDFLKLDCEGSEGLILGSAPPSTLDRIRRISMEFHDYASPLKHDELVQLLQQAGFETRLNWDGKSACGYLYASREK